MLLIGTAGLNDTSEDVIAYLEAHPEVDIFISEIKSAVNERVGTIEKNQGTFSASVRNSLLLRYPCHGKPEGKTGR